MRDRHVLFICEGNLHRSPTAERLYATTPGLKPRSAGLSSLARVQVTEELLAWADVIFVMERRLRRMLRQRFPNRVAATPLVCLDVPDDYQLMQPELITELRRRLEPHLGRRSRGKMPPLLLDTPKSRAYHDRCRECPYRLAAQDIALSRRRQGFESP